MWDMFPPPLAIAVTSKTTQDAIGVLVREA